MSAKVLRQRRKNAKRRKLLYARNRDKRWRVRLGVSTWEDVGQEALARRVNGDAMRRRAQIKRDMKLETERRMRIEEERIRRRFGWGWRPEAEGRGGQYY